MILVVGLGNPGEKYENTRHNLGFSVLDEFSENNNFPDFKFSKKFKAFISKNSLNGKTVVLAKPQTFMNDSGKALKLLTSAYKLKSSSVFIVHDDIDLDLGRIKIIKNRGTAGHKGIQSIVDELKTKNFVRFRIGIKPRLKFKSIFYRLKRESFVLKKFTKKEKDVIKKAIKKCVEIIEFALKEGIEKTMNKFN